MLKLGGSYRSLLYESFYFCDCLKLSINKPFYKIEITSSIYTDVSQLPFFFYFTQIKT